MQQTDLTNPWPPVQRDVLVAIATGVKQVAVSLFHHLELTAAAMQQCRLWHRLIRSATANLHPAECSAHRLHRRGRDVQFARGQAAHGRH